MDIQLARAERIALRVESRCRVADERLVVRDQNDRRFLPDGGDGPRVFGPVGQRNGQRVSRRKLPAGISNARYPSSERTISALCAYMTESTESPSAQ